MIVAVLVATHVEPTVLTLIVYVPDAKPLNVALLWYAPLFKRYSKFVPVAFTTIVPVLTVHVGCIIVDVPTVGVLGTALIVAVPVPTHVEPIVLTRIVYVPDAKPLNVALLWYAPLFKLYSKFVPVAFTTIVPVLTVHVGCVTVAVPTVGTPVTALIVAVPVPTHVEPTVLTLIVYVPDAKPLNVALLWYAPPFKLYSNGLVPVAFTTSVPVLTVHVGCVTVAVPTEGAPVTALIVAVPVPTHVEPTVLTLIVYVPDAKPLNVALLWYAPLFKLYSKFVPVAFTTIVPVLTVHVGCVIVAVPTVGAPVSGL